MIWWPRNCSAHSFRNFWISASRMVGMTMTARMESPFLYWDVRPEGATRGRRITGRE